MPTFLKIQGYLWHLADLLSKKIDAKNVFSPFQGKFDYHS